MKIDTSAEVVSDIENKENQKKVLDQIDQSGLGNKQRQIVEQ